MPAAAATSSIEVAAKPRSANATAAARRIDSRRSASRGTSPLYRCIRLRIHLKPMSTVQLEWTEAELLASHPVAEPLIAGGVRCHGGFADDGSYVSPRTKNRWPAIGAWQAQRREQFGTPLLDIQ